MTFDQRIDPASVLKTISVSAGNEQVKLVLATQAEIEKDDTVSVLVKNAVEGRWLAFRGTKPFPPDTAISVRIVPGTPSAEGPLTTTQEQSFGFSTYPPLRIEEHGCSWYDKRCPPLTPLSIRFNNPLDLDVFQEEMLRIEPEIPGLSVNVYGNSLEISGETRGQTTYTVTVSGKLQDVFGQRLGEDTRLTFKVDRSDPILVGPTQNFVTLDPSTPKPVLSVYAMNYTRLDTKIYAVQPADWPQYINYLREWNRSDQPPTPPGVLVANKSLALRLPSDTLSQVDIDLSQYMVGKSGHFVVIVEPPPGLLESQEDKYRRYSQTVITWVQITQIGLDAFVDQTQMVAWATDLKSGAPLAGVNVRPGNGGASVVTGADGLARWDIPSGATYLIAQKGADQAILPHSSYFWDDSTWAASSPQDTLRWYVFDDRQHVPPRRRSPCQGLAAEHWRQTGWRRGAGGQCVKRVSYQLNDSQGNALGNGRAEVNALGGFDFAFTLPESTNLGTAQVSLTAEGDFGALDGMQYTHPFQVQEFRRPEFEVTARNETAGSLFCRGSRNSGGGGQILCRGRPAQRRRDLAGDYLHRQLLTAQLAGFHLWHLETLVDCSTMAIRASAGEAQTGNLYRQDRCHRHAFPAHGFQSAGRIAQDTEPKA